MRLFYNPILLTNYFYLLLIGLVCNTGFIFLRIDYVTGSNYSIYRFRPHDNLKGKSIHVCTYRFKPITSRWYRFDNINPFYFNGKTETCHDTWSGIKKTALDIKLLEVYHVKGFSVLMKFYHERLNASENCWLEVRWRWRWRVPIETMVTYNHFVGRVNNKKLWPV